MPNFRSDFDPWWLGQFCKFLKYQLFTFSNIIPEPSMSQQCTIWQMDHLYLANVALFHHFYPKWSKTAQKLYKREVRSFPSTQKNSKSILFIPFYQKIGRGTIWSLKLFYTVYFIIRKRNIQAPIHFISTLMIRLWSIPKTALLVG